MDFNDFGVFLKTVRLSKGVTQGDLSRGLCSGSEISKIEKGEREPGFLMQCVLLNRLSVTNGSYTNYAFKQEFDGYIERNRIRRN